MREKTRATGCKKGVFVRWTTKWQIESATYNLKFHFFEDMELAKHIEKILWQKFIISLEKVLAKNQEFERNRL